jgi:hypothetical protein
LSTTLRAAWCTPCAARRERRKSCVAAKTRSDRATARCGAAAADRSLHLRRGVRILAAEDEVERFERVDDGFGHRAGDAREELLALLSATDANAASRVAPRVAIAVAKDAR